MPARDPTPTPCTPVTCASCPWWLRAGPTTPDGYCRRRVTPDVRGRHWVWPATHGSRVCVEQPDDDGGDVKREA